MDRGGVGCSRLGATSERDREGQSHGVGAQCRCQAPSTVACIPSLVSIFFYNKPWFQLSRFQAFAYGATPCPGCPMSGWNRGWDARSWRHNDQGWSDSDWTGSGSSSWWTSTDTSWRGSSWLGPADGWPEGSWMDGHGVVRTPATEPGVDYSKLTMKEKRDVVVQPGRD